MFPYRLKCSLESWFNRSDSCARLYQKIDKLSLIFFGQKEGKKISCLSISEIFSLNFAN